MKLLASTGPGTVDTHTVTAGAVLRAGVAALEAGGIPSPALAAELLLMHALQRNRTWLYAHPEYELAPNECAHYERLIESRRGHVPTQYLTGHQEFWGLDFGVGPGVLIPRPETEHVIEVALDRLGHLRAKPLRFADIGTGSGCIAVALAHEFPTAEIIATDVSLAALSFARRNAEMNDVVSRIRFFEADLLSGIENADLGFDLVASNPPYVGREDAPTLPTEVREHEPAQALFAGDQGLDFYPRLIAAAENALRPTGLLIFEIGYNAPEFARTLLSSPKWEDVRVMPDLAGIERVVSATRAG